MQKRNLLLFGFGIILAAAMFYALAFVIGPTLFMTNRQVTTQPEQVVQDFYGWYLSYEGNPLVDRAYRSNEYLSQDMLAFQDEFTQNEVGYDPVICAQDKPSRVSPSATHVSGGQAGVDVATSFEDHRFSVELMQTNGDWLINKVICAP